MKNLTNVFILNNFISVKRPAYSSTTSQKSEHISKGPTASSVQVALVNMQESSGGRREEEDSAM